MSQPASFVVTKNKVFWSKKSDSHQDIIEEYHLVEMVNNQVTFVRTEISPEDRDLRRPPKEWKFIVEQDILPDWYDPKEVERRCRIALTKWRKTKLIIDKNAEIKNGQIYVYGNSQVKAYNSSQVFAYNLIQVFAYNSSQVLAHDSSRVFAYDSSRVLAYDSSRVFAYNSSWVEAYDSSQVVDCKNYATVRSKEKNPVD